jgi:hypothetical protein
MSTDQQREEQVDRWEAGQHDEEIDRVLANLVRDGSLVLCADGRYRCTELGAQRVAEDEANYTPPLDGI